jgi:hypothetical protein
MKLDCLVRVTFEKSQLTNLLEILVESEKIFVELDFQINRTILWIDYQRYLKRPEFVSSIWTLRDFLRGKFIFKVRWFIGLELEGFSGNCECERSERMHSCEVFKRLH